MNIDLNNMKNKKCIGMVFNTDPHTGGGQHWFSMFIDQEGINMDKPAIYYFDSLFTSIKKLKKYQTDYRINE